ncbi:MAG: hypothetical protein Q4C47_03350, partial [Planctomycetia bacterium]|nr:hypothetical protein [Planctomycetia bacterium]
MKTPLRNVNVPDLTFLYVVLTILSFGIVPDVHGSSALAQTAPEPSPAATTHVTTPTKVTVELNGRIVPPSPGSVTGTWFFGGTDGTGPQILLLGFPESGLRKQPFYRLVASLRPGEMVTLRTGASDVGDLSRWKSTHSNGSVRTYCGTESDGSAFMTLTVPETSV